MGIYNLREIERRGIRQAIDTLHRQGDGDRPILNAFGDALAALVSKPQIAYGAFTQVQIKKRPDTVLAEHDLVGAGYAQRSIEQSFRPAAVDDPDIIRAGGFRIVSQELFWCRKARPVQIVHLHSSQDLEVTLADRDRVQEVSGLYARTAKPKFRAI